MDNIPTPEEMEAARRACGLQAPIFVLMGWVLEKRRAALNTDFVDSVQHMSGSDVSD